MDTNELLALLVRHREELRQWLDDEQYQYFLAMLERLREAGADAERAGMAALAVVRSLWPVPDEAGELSRVLHSDLRGLVEAPVAPSRDAVLAALEALYAAPAAGEREGPPPPERGEDTSGTPLEAVPSAATADPAGPDPADPADPVVAADPLAPADPHAPVDPADPLVPADPSVPPGPGDPVVAADPPAPVDPSVPPAPAHPADPPAPADRPARSAPADAVDPVAVVIAAARRRLLAAPSRAAAPAGTPAAGAGPADVIVLTDPEDGRRSPEFQFDPETGRPRDIVVRINRMLLADIDPWGAADWWLGGNSWLGGAPASLLGRVPDDRLADAALALVGEDGR
ncbi:hypothetical protein [Streptomyces sp. A012304]|uniref:hypothetical protein n=1 Tax=Streptomyces sp. A012304 TaxID=375446 RepID=UPI00222F1600|nr:hypothetical protein [Streptomyces sp. A012304]GKQ36911.1 hypothetical protein ALMP_34510 [Streptomyces sp. A012304]